MVYVKSVEDQGFPRGAQIYMKFFPVGCVLEIAPIPFLEAEHPGGKPPKKEYGTRQEVTLYPTCGQKNRCKNITF